MPKTIYKATLTQVNDLTKSVRELVFKPTQEFMYAPGQFVMVQVPQPDGKVAQRAYSIASTPRQKGEFRLVIKHFDGGVASQWVRALKGGEVIDFTGPFGKFLLKEPPAKQIVMICTSTGVAPFHSIIATHCASFPEISWKLMMGVWNEDEIFYKKEFDGLIAKNKNLSVEFVVDKPKGNWGEKTGRVTDHLGSIDWKIDSEVYLCGNPEMIKATKEALLNLGLGKQKILTESYG